MKTGTTSTFHSSAIYDKDGVLTASGLNWLLQSNSPANEEQLRATLVQRRRSLSPSSFDAAENFRFFKKAHCSALNEAAVVASLIRHAQKTEWEFQGGLGTAWSELAPTASKA